jgi:hypothetical protein
MVFAANLSSACLHHWITASEYSHTHHALSTCPHTSHTHNTHNISHLVFSPLHTSQGDTEEYQEALDLIYKLVKNRDKDAARLNADIGEAALGVSGSV